MTQYALPDASYQTTVWVEGAGDGDGDWFDELDEGFGAGRGSGSGPDDITTYWQSVSAPTNDPIETTLSDVTDPTTSDGHVFRTRDCKSAANGKQMDLLVALKKVAVTIASVTYPNIDEVWTTRGKTLTGAEADSISDYTDLIIKSEANAVGGGAPRPIQESAFEFECPDAVVVSFAPLQQQIDAPRPPIEIVAY